ncbi:MAG: hypothetical protein EAZ53_00800 [Bacteroidetes bacterium]|nr:MAG: hypothetical protein EAZ53_00800 [Bacteroidota bacterium]
MKNIIYIFALISFASFAQIEKGKKYLGGDINISYKSIPASPIVGSSATLISISPKFLYFLSDKFAIGLSAYYTSNRFNEDNLSFTSLGIGPTARYVFPIRENIFLFAESNVSFGSSNIFKGLVLTGYINPGVTVFLSKKFALEAAFASFNVYFNKNQPSAASISFNPLSKVGVSFYF